MTETLIDELEQQLCISITQTHMFGGVGLFYQSAMFALYRAGRLAIKIQNDDQLKAAASGFKPSQYLRKKTWQANGFYVMPDNLSNQEQLMWLRLSIDVAIKRKSTKPESAINQLRNLPNIDPKLERRLIKAGINSPCELKEIGAERALRKISSSNQTLLRKLTGAITGHHWLMVELKPSEACNFK